MKDMQVCQTNFDFLTERMSENRDWYLANEHCTFVHKGACEFIFYLGSHTIIQELREKGFSESFIDECQRAIDNGYKYICFYA